MSLQGAPGITQPPNSEAPSPREGFHRVEFVRHYRNFQAGDRAILPIEEVEAELAKAPNEQRFTVVKKGRSKKSTSRAGQGVGLRNARFD